MTTVTTNRLLLRPWTAGDFEDYAQMQADPEVVRYIGDGKPQSRIDAWRNMAAIVGHWVLRGYGLWAVQERSSGRLVGRAGLYQPEGWPGIEAGWMLAREFWGMGYATEAGRATLDYAFAERGEAHVISLIYPGNFRSIKVAERLGETFERTIELGGRETLVYGIARSDWKK